MPAKPKNPDYFGTFLTSMSESGTQSTHAAELQRQLLHKLLVDGGKSSVRALLDSLPVPPSIIVGALKGLEEAGLIEISAAGSDESAQLTPLGRSISA